MEDKQIKEALAALAKDGNKEAFAQVITEYIDPGHITLDMVSLLLDTRGLNPGDSLVKKIRKTLARVWTWVN